ncbi:MAG: DMT family transporter [Thermotaleaceae bacterium]
MNQYKGTILILFSAFGFALMPIFARFAYLSEISVPTLLFIRFTIASFFFFGYIIVKKISFVLTPRDVFMLFILGTICYTLMSNFYLISVKYISVTLAVLILYTYPIIVSILSSILDKEIPSKKIILSLFISFIGLIMVLGTSIGQVSTLGIFFALGSSMVYSLYIILGNRVIRKIPSLITTAFITFFSSLGTFLLGWISKDISFHFQGNAWSWALGISLFSTIFAILAFFKGMELTGPTRASILSMAEPLFSILISILLFGDTLTISQQLGGFILLLGTFLTAKSQEGIHNKQIDAHLKKDISML